MKANTSDSQPRQSSESEGRIDLSFDLKLMDHIFDSGKVMVTVFVRLVAVYVTVLAIFSAAVVSDFGGTELLDAFRKGCLLATGAVLLGMIMFHHYVLRAISGYCKIASEIADQYHVEKILKYKRKISHFGTAMLFIGALALVLVAAALYNVPYPLF